DRTTGEKKQIKGDGLFVAIGLIPENEAFRSVAKLNARGYFDSDEDCMTGSEGIFVAGDCRNKKIRQVATAVADGAVAALAACSYINERV
ncbi:MAG: FAD-dependent oxidoreductase, partial [Firmicutes bacterium]|nr:FAD-dependent oxidoreductase [Bacillota bacterium]